MDPQRPTPSPGATISNLLAVRRPQGGPAGLGVVGFLATRGRGSGRLMLVSNHHVLHAHGAVAGAPIYQPEYRTSSRRLTFEPEPRPIAVLEGGGLEGNLPFAYRRDPPGSYFVDCAAAALDSSAETFRRGRVLFRSIARARRRDTLPGRELGVCKLGIDESITGTLIAADATVMLSDGTLRYNNLVIRGRKGSDGARLPFASVGQSGALVVDRRRRAIGLLWGVNLADPAEAYACHIHPVLARLGLVPLRHALEPADG